MNLIPRHANNDDPSSVAWGQNQKILEWLNRLTQSDAAFDTLGLSLNRNVKVSADNASSSSMSDDWQAVMNICGYGSQEFMGASAGLPLTAAEIEHFRRNHRGTESHVNRDFLTSRTDLPSPLAELYGLYLHRARLDAEATLFLAQATNSTRVARIMADLLAIGGFANSLEYISYLGLTYSIPAAFDTSAIVDHSNNEAARRLSLPVDHPSHLLKLKPDEIGALATNVAEKHCLAASEFLEKSNLLAEARQDVTRLPNAQHFITAIIERDLPTEKSWVLRLCGAYARILETWVAGLPEAERLIQ